MLQSQRGASTLGLVFGALVFVAILKVALITWPAYWDDYIINKQIVETLKTNDSSISIETYSAKMAESFSRNNIEDLKFASIAKVERKEGQLQVKKDYEVRRHLFLNIDLILSFEKSFDQRSVQAK
ncbi:DUF4845 domain-containing protein [Acinetobacter sp. MD2(2019)]|uniref:DUF4845 domain-containing protein n=1 Tax=Acinetobacter sp. MD2(2019) TaxID=2605273 RepID=UPI002D1E8264|nr:DUF4845 domain-containing protein [Acinetobacter sp. MD2(2019)]MEB3754398.1 DUF4845 domain-containing protein [Acinetobacter sp. MD2(2019)]